MVAFAAMERSDRNRWGPNDPFAEQRAATKALREWAKVHAQRDEVIRTAVEAGIDHRTIQEITGVARTTIARIIRQQD